MHAMQTLFFFLYEQCYREELAITVIFYVNKKKKLISVFHRKHGVAS